MKYTIVSDIYEHIHHKIQGSIIFGQIGLEPFWGENIYYIYFCQSTVSHHSKMLKLKALQRIIRYKVL